jgi:subtilisin
MDADRHLVLFRHCSPKSALELLHRCAGLRAAPACAVPPASADAYEAVLFTTLGIATVRADPDQLAALRRFHALRVVTDRVVAARELHGTRAPSEAIAVPPAAARTLPLSDTFFATWGLQAIRAVSSRYSGRGVRVAILDTGLDFSHPDFAHRNVVAQSFVHELPPQDENGHGTFCAGIACGPSQPHHAPRYGVAPDAELYVARVLDERASGTDGNVLAGIDWAVRAGCAVISMSFGNPVALGDRYPEVYEEVAARALAAGSVLIAPAGNASQRPDNIAPAEHPGNCPSILNVGAVDASLTVASFSNGGLNPDGGCVSVVAPGIGVLSAAPHPELYQTSSGTSMATPFVAGVAALWAEADPAARGAALRERLLESCLALSELPRDVGAGLVQAPQ